MVPSAVINEAIVFSTVLALRALVRRTPKEKLPESFRFFTVLSNLFCALTAMILLLCELFGAMPPWATAFKYMGTVAVTVTFLTVLVFLWPSLGTVHGLWDGPELVMHLLTPLLAILSFLCFERRGLSAWIIPLGILPVLLYGILYFHRVMVAKTWRDMYGFNKNGRWKLSFALMLLGTAVIAVLLWAL